MIECFTDIFKEYVIKEYLMTWEHALEKKRERDKVASV